MWLRVISILLVTASVAATAQPLVPLGLDLHVPSPAGNPLTDDKIELGRRLFFDRRLSRDETVSCASCHEPERAFTDARPIAVGIAGRVGTRNTPSLINLAYAPRLFWDGRATSLEQQVIMPIEDRNEMDFDVSAAAARTGISVTTLSHALASYVRSILVGDSPFDRFVAGDRTALTPTQQAGLHLFRGKANCTACHVGPTFSDHDVHNTGVAWTGTGFADVGAGDGRFKTPTLRELAWTAPYMHDGSITSLEDVIEYYDRGGNRHGAIDPEIRRLHLTTAEKQQLRDFLSALNGTITAAGTAAARAPDHLSAFMGAAPQRASDRFATSSSGPR